jgi:hypothetical protein
MECAKCHPQEVQSWLKTPHYAAFETLHRSPEAKEIARRLELKSIKRNDTCVQCHYTPQMEDNRLRVVAGVSCESCHGAARDWVALHADYGGSATRETESPDHRQERITASVAAGMNNPDNVYLLAKQCLNCHTVPHEELVNVGGHRAGSPDFELVSWSQGMVRHNFVTSGGTANRPSGQERLRVMFVVGVMADLEYSLRATAVAREKATYGITCAQRAVLMKRRLAELARLTGHPRLQQALDAVSTVELKLNNSAALLAAADQIADEAFRFADETDGSELSAIDPLLPDPGTYRN